ncbi:MAG: M48 family metallopeptidase [Halodesulfurarchaeum sp.]
MLPLHAAFLLLLGGTTAFFVGLSALNVHYAHRRIDERADWLRTELGVADPERVQAYHRLRTAIGQLRSVLGLAAVLAVLYTGLFADVVAAVSSVGGPVLAGVLLLLLLVVAAQLFALPFEVVETFGIEAAFGFNEQTPWQFVRDTLLSTGISVALTAVVGAAILWVIDTVPGWWWLAATGVVGVVVLASQVLVPRAIMPLFYDFEPVAEGDLREAVEGVFERAGFACEEVYEMNASSRSGHSNAFFVGFGPAKRVVLYDTLIEQLETSQLQAVLAHELAHWKQGHVWQRLGVTVIQAGLALAAAQVLLGQPWLSGMFGVPDLPAAGLVLAALWLGPVLDLASPIRNALSLSNERAADGFAAEVMGDGAALAGALLTLQRENLGNPFPHPWYELFHYQHPPVTDRVRDLVGAEGNG